MLSPAGLERTGLIGLGSRVGHRVLVRLPGEATPAQVRAAAEPVRAAVADPEFVEVETYAEAQPALRNGLARVERFLGLVALLSLLIGGIGVAQAVRAWLAGRLDAIAVLRALGVRPREVFALYLGQTALLALVGSVAGALAGALVARVVPGLIGDLLPVQVEVGWQPAAMARGVALGVGVARAVRPAAAVRRPAGAAGSGAAPRRRSAAREPRSGDGAVCRAGRRRDRDRDRSVGFAGARGAVRRRTDRGDRGAFAGAWLVVRAVGTTPREFRAVALRHGLAALARPGSGTLGAVVALGLGVLTVLGMYLVQDRLSAQLDADLPDDAPTVFLVDIQPDQWDGVRAALEEAGAENLDSVEVVMARLQAINAVPVDELVPERGEDSR